MTYHCLFEQSGTFKNEFIKLGYNAIDYDILNDYGETDRVIDLFEEIESAYFGSPSIFDEIKEEDQILAFFPCIRFEDQIQMHFRGTSNGMQKWDTIKKLENDLDLHSDLHHLYNMVTMLAIVCLRKKIPLILENPYSTTHYLVKYWPIKAAIIDMDRRDMGDYYMKPTQYWFIGREPSNNFIFEGVDIKKSKRIDWERGAERSMISKDYANRFIREFVLPPCEDSCDVQQ